MIVCNQLLDVVMATLKQALLKHNSFQEIGK